MSRVEEKETLKTLINREIMGLKGFLTVVQWNLVIFGIFVFIFKETNQP